MQEVIPKTVRIESIPCPLGCEADDELVYQGFDRLHDLPGKYSVVKCKVCGLQRTNPRPTPDSIGYYYPDNYAPYQITKVNSDKASKFSKVLKNHIKRLFQFNTQIIPDLTPGEMLEVGCASGSFMHRMALDGWKVAGIEFSAQAAKEAQGLGYKVHIGTIESMPDDKSDSYDLIVGWMVIEHLHDPINVLEKLYKWVKPGGYLVISIPNAGSLEAKIFKNAWYASQLPTHLYHYSPQTVESILAKTGWKIEKIFHQRVISSLIASMGYVLKDKEVLNGFAAALINMPSKGNKWNYIFYPLAYVLSLFGQTGRMTIWARK